MSGVTSAGFEPSSETEILEGLRDQARSQVDAALVDPITYPQTTWGTLATIVARGLRGLWEQGALAYRALDPRYAEGDQLDALGVLRGVSRLTPAPSLVSVSYVIPGGGSYAPGAIVVKASSDPTLYVNRDTVPSGTGTATFVSTTDTSTVPPLGALSPVSVPVGSTFTATGVTAGVAYETDAAYLVRQEASLARAGGSTRDALLADLLATQGVSTASVTTVSPGTLSVILSGSPQAADVWAAMHNNVAGGVAQTGTTSYTAPSPVDGALLTYYWQVASTTSVSIALTVTTTAALTPTEKTALQTAWRDAVAALWSAGAPGATLRLSDVVEAAVTLSQVKYADVASARIQGAFADYSLGTTVVPVIGTATLTVLP
jgi:hypothetical protein